MFYSRYFHCIAFAVIVLGFFFSCKRTIQKVDDVNWNPPSNESFNDSITLKTEKTLKLILDSANILYYETCQYDAKNNIVVSYNSANSNMLLFDYVSGKLKQKINLVGLGIKPKHPGDQKAYSFNFVNSDSIFFYDHRSEKVVLFDTSTKVLKKYLLSSNENGYSKGIIVMGELLSVGGDSLYVASAPGRRVLDQFAPLRENLVLTTSLSTAASRPTIRYPDIYRKAKWGYYLHKFHMLYNSENNIVVISYPVDHFLNIYDSSGRCYRYYAGGKGMRPIKPLRFLSDNTPVGKDEDAVNFRSQRTYGTILYDRFRHLYYRVISSAIPEKDMERSLDPSYKKEQPMTIVILNSSFVKVGEVAIDANKYSTTSMFVSHEGLCVPLTKSNDDNLFFDVFSVQPVKK